MNWPFSKQTIKHNIVPRMVQKDFETEQKKIQQFEDINKKLYKDIKRYLDTIDETIKCETKMVNNLLNITVQQQQQPPPISSDISSSSQQLTQNIDDFNKKLNVWKQTLQNHDHTEKFKQVCTNEVVEPMKKLNSIFPSVYQAIKKRENAYNELVKQQNKLEKLQEKDKTGSNLVKLEQFKQTFQATKEIFQKEHLQLMDELPKLYDSRINYLFPCIQQLIQGQIEFYERYTQIYENLLNDYNCLSRTNSCDDAGSAGTNASGTGAYGGSSSITPSTASTATTTTTSSASSVILYDYLNDAQIDADIQKCLNDIKSLSIVASD